MTTNEMIARIDERTNSIASNVDALSLNVAQCLKRLNKLEQGLAVHEEKIHRLAATAAKYIGAIVAVIVSIAINIILGILS